MSNIVDLNIIFPKEEVISFEATDGVVYNITISIPSKLALRFIQLNKEKEEKNKNDFEIANDMVLGLMIKKYPKTTKEWIEENMSWREITYIAATIKEEVFGSLDIIAKSISKKRDNETEKK